MPDAPTATLNTDPPTQTTGAKIVGSEGAPLITSALIVSGLHDAWGLLVEHLDFWPLSDNLFTLAALVLFMILRKDTSGYGRAMPEATSAQPAPRRARSAPVPSVVPVGVLTPEQALQAADGAETRQEFEAAVRAAAGRAPVPDVPTAPPANDPASTAPTPLATDPSP